MTKPHSATKGVKVMITSWLQLFMIGMVLFQSAVSTHRGWCVAREGTQDVWGYLWLVQMPRMKTGALIVSMQPGSSWMDGWMGNRPNIRPMPTPCFRRQSPTGYYKKSYQQCSQEQMVRRRSAQTGSSCQYRT